MSGYDKGRGGPPPRAPGIERLQEYKFEDKLLVDDKAPPQKIDRIDFGVHSGEEITKMSVVEVNRDDMYWHAPAAPGQPTTREPAANGPLDRRLGTTEKGSICATCHEPLQTCSGHFGHYKLTLPIFHQGYFKAIVGVLASICKTCALVLLDDAEFNAALNFMRRVTDDHLRRQAKHRAIVDACKKISMCPHCGAMNGPIKKVPNGGTRYLLLIHDRFAKDNDSSQAFQDALLSEDPNFSLTKRNPDLKPAVGKAAEDLDPLTVLNLFRRIPDHHVEVLNMRPEQSRPEHLLVTHIPVPPCCIRPSVAMGVGAGSNEDDLTVILSEIVKASEVLQETMDKGGGIANVMECWGFLQLKVAYYFNSELPGVQQQLTVKSGKRKVMRGFAQRLKGKQGRFRGNLSGKRVDHSGRTVISPDPNLHVRQVAVPVHMAKTLTYPERVTAHNMKRLKAAIHNGPDTWPGATHLLVQGLATDRKDLRYYPRREAKMRLRIGDIVERHLIDDDVVLFNRQPSLHRISIMAHRAKILEWRTLRFNECVCNPYNADFDGDEMNLHVPQTEEARVEAIELMGVVNNLCTPKDGSIMVAATQDFLTGSYLITRKNTFFTKAQMSQYCCFTCDANDHFELPPPAIIKPMQLWTGKQLFTLLIRPYPGVKSLTSDVEVLVTTELGESQYEKKTDGDIRKGRHMCPHDSYVCFRNSELICGTLGKATLGAGNKNSLFYVLLRDCDADTAADRMTRLAKLCARYMGLRGFTFGIEDVMPTDAIRAAKQGAMDAAHVECTKLIELYRTGKLERVPGCDLELSLEQMVGKELDNVRNIVASAAKKALHFDNKVLVMALCKSKGSNENISQMIGCLGQQKLAGARIPNGFIGRTLPHFEVNAKDPPSKGFVANSFFTGLNPTEFFMHTMTGREGLVDTAVKTAECGYMARRLMKALEDLSIHYDNTVRNSHGGIVQFRYGDDGLDPLLMEDDDGRPLNLRRMLLRSTALVHANGEPALDPMEGQRVIQKWFEQPVPFRRSNKPRELSEYSDKEWQTARSPKDVLSEQFVVDLDIFLIRYGLLPPKKNDGEAEARGGGEETMRVTERQLLHMLDECLCRYRRAIAEPGGAVGAMGAQSIGEPGTQMTLKTFHFAGIASMNVTLGVPRIKEIINASKVISTPVIEVPLVNDKDEVNARIIKGRIERTTLGQVAKSIKMIYAREGCHIVVKLDVECIQALQLNLSVSIVRKAIISDSKLKVKDKNIDFRGSDALMISPTHDARSKESLHFTVINLAHQLRNVIVCGVASIRRAVIQTLEQKAGEPNRYQLFVEGTGLQEVMATSGVKGTKSRTNHVMEMQAVLGIEAARRTIMREIGNVLSQYGIAVDKRHTTLLAEVMTFKGEVLGITRFGLSKMKESVLMLASFEKTVDHLFDAAIHGRSDRIVGVSECIILGTPVQIGTGSFKLLFRSEPTHQPPKRRSPLLRLANGEKHLAIFGGGSA
mmetsp:Transcript_61091/g.144156  ORF Transcript_61091/g.144156 Transcript_61091/m.144156 type:complete len:1479 (-) Transcript_61091:130-4566(-)|eukprot:CAMPEP_0177703482 /NCGR_PEP_ID=MMETSP0484_2-20121128/7696_1 /TAXON_ID=354590 /ORGANISM="Rhodomonas lens, Strain RHODO" /LENGTH=1478 /DNA_ID=CAMNT_0019214841 /DNA_START=228 /DNA_END=4664 /DNA_ORIENTATION=+